MRIIHAMAEIVCEEGLEAATVSRVCSLAGASPRAFHALFADRDDCLAQAFDETLARASARMRAACAGAAGSDERVRAALRALIVFVEEEPELATMCVTQSFTPGSPQLGHADRLLSRLIAGLVRQPAASCDRSPGRG